MSSLDNDAMYEFLYFSVHLQPECLARSLPW